MLSTTSPKSAAYFCAFGFLEVSLHLQSEIKREKMSSATPRRHLSKDDKLAIIEASKSPGFSKEEAMKNGE